MGQKVDPRGIRLGISRDWSTKWYSTHNFASNIKDDAVVRDFLRNKFKHAAVSEILIERPAKNMKVTIRSARPGVIIGKKGHDVELVKNELIKKIGYPLSINIDEVRKPELDANLVSQSVAQQLEKRIMFRRAMKRAVSLTMRAGAKGIKVSVGGRLNGAEIARTEWYREGRVPLHTFKANIDYGTASAMTTYGIIGVKTWIYLGNVSEVLPIGVSHDETQNK